MIKGGQVQVGGSKADAFPGGRWTVVPAGSFSPRMAICPPAICWPWCKAVRSEQSLNGPISSRVLTISFHLPPSAEFVDN